MRRASWAELFSLASGLTKCRALFAAWPTAERNQKNQIEPCFLVSTCMLPHCNMMPCAVAKSKRERAAHAGASLGPEPCRSRPLLVKIVEGEKRLANIVAVQTPGTENIFGGNYSAASVAQAHDDFLD